jgi:hypothetical protein
MHHYAVVKLLDILDTSVKVGLGAVIGGLGSIWMARRQRQHEFDKEMMRRRCDTLERISDDFEQHHTLLVDWFATARVQSGLRASGQHSEDIDNAEKKAQDMIGESAPQMHKVVGKLMLLGFANCAKAHDEYAVQFGQLLQFGKRYHGKPEHTQQEWVDAWSKVDSARNRFHAELSKAYLQRP